MKVNKIQAFQEWRLWFLENHKKRVWKKHQK